MSKVTESQKLIVPLPEDGQIYFPVCLLKMPGHLVGVYAHLLALNTGDFFAVDFRHMTCRIGVRQTRTSIQDLVALGLIETRHVPGERLQARVLPLDPRGVSGLPHRNSHRATVRARDRGLCRYCGAVAEEFEHVVPRCRGGTDHANNVVMSCRPCNLRKGPRTPEEAGMVLRPAPGGE